MKALPLGQLLPMPNKVTARERGQRKNSCQPFYFLIECLLKKLSLFAHWGLTCGSCWKKLRILYRSESCSKVFSLWGLPPPKIKSRVTRNKKHISNQKYETGPSGGRAPRTRARAREDQAEGLPFLLVCLSISSFQVPRPPDIPIVLLLLFPKQEEFLSLNGLHL